METKSRQIFYCLSLSMAVSVKSILLSTTFFIKQRQFEAAYIFCLRQFYTWMTPSGPLILSHPTWKLSHELCGIGGSSFLLQTKCWLLLCSVYQIFTHINKKSWKTDEKVKRDSTKTISLLVNQHGSKKCILLNKIMANHISLKVMHVLDCVCCGPIQCAHTSHFLWYLVS